MTTSSSTPGRKNSSPRASHAQKGRFPRKRKDKISLHPEQYLPAWIKLQSFSSAPTLPSLHHALSPTTPHWNAFKSDQSCNIQGLTLPAWMAQDVQHQKLPPPSTPHAIHRQNKDEMIKMAATHPAPPLQRAARAIRRMHKTARIDNCTRTQRNLMRSLSACTVIFLAVLCILLIARAALCNGGAGCVAAILIISSLILPVDCVRSGRRRQLLMLHILSHPRSKVKPCMLQDWSDLKAFQWGVVGESA